MKTWPAWLEECAQRILDRFCLPQPPLDLTPGERLPKGFPDCPPLSEEPWTPPARDLEPVTPVPVQDAPLGAERGEGPGEPPRPSPTALQLIEIRDHVFAALHEERPISLTWLYGRLGTVLASEEIETLQREGAFDWQTQLVVSTRPTTDRAQDEAIFATVRPGYRFSHALVRPQEVVVYAYAHE